MNSAKKNLLNGTIIYFIGNVLVTLLQLVMLRFITGNITTDGYGYYNLIVTIDNLVTPIITLQISDAVFRGMIKGELKEQKTAFTIGTCIIFAGIIVTAFGTVLISSYIYAVEHLPLVILYIISTNIFVFYQKIVRALGENVSYVKSNLMKAFLYLLLQMVFIYAFHLAVESLFLATILSTFICVLYMELKVKCRRYFDLELFDKLYLKKMVLFSIPLIPNTLLWWLSGSINSFIISGVIGLEAYGIYTVAGKFSSIISTISSVFNLAWQESAIREYGNNGNKEFYKDTFEMFFNGVLSCVIGCMPVMFLLMPHLIDASYNSALLYAPILVLSAGVSSIYGFFGQMYAATGKTGGAFTTTIFGVGINIIILIVFIKPFGLWAPCLGLLLSSLAIAVVRFRSFRKEMGIFINPKMIGLIAVLCLIILCYYFGNTVLNTVALIVAVLLALAVNKGLIKDCFYILRTKVGGKA